MIYAVDTKTKKHRYYSQGGPLSLDECIKDADADGWIEWAGSGECPLPDNQPCEVTDKRGDVTSFKRPELEINWLAVKDYRPILEPQAEQVKEWNGEELPPVDIACEREGDKGKWFPVIPKIYSNGKVCCLAESKDGKLDALAIFSADSYKFRPRIEPQSEQAKEWRGPENGLPPICSKVRLIRVDGEVEVVAHGAESSFCAKLKSGRLMVCDISVALPIRTDRERWIAAAEHAIEDKTGEPASSGHLGILYDAGLSRLPD